MEIQIMNQNLHNMGWRFSTYRTYNVDIQHVVKRHVRLAYTFTGHGDRWQLPENINECANICHTINNAYKPINQLSLESMPTYRQLYNHIVLQGHLVGKGHFIEIERGINTSDSVVYIYR